MLSIDGHRCYLRDRRCRRRDRNSVGPAATGLPGPADVDVDPYMSWTGPAGVPNPQRISDSLALASGVAPGRAYLDLSSGGGWVSAASFRLD